MADCRRLLVSVLWQFTMAQMHLYWTTRVGTTRSYRAYDAMRCRSCRIRVRARAKRPTPTRYSTCRRLGAATCQSGPRGFLQAHGPETSRQVRSILITNISWRKLVAIAKAPNSTVSRSTDHRSPRNEKDVANPLISARFYGQPQHWRLLWFWLSQHFESPKNFIASPIAIVIAFIRPVTRHASPFD